MLRTITNSSWKYNDEVAVHCISKQIQEELFHHLSSPYAPHYPSLRLLMTVHRSSRARTSSPAKNHVFRPPSFSFSRCFPLRLPLLLFTSYFLTGAQLFAVAEVTECCIDAAGWCLFRVHASCADAKQKKKRRRPEGKPVLSGPIWVVC